MASRRFSKRRFSKRQWRFQVEPLERRDLLSAVAWTGAVGDNQWSDAANWSTGTVPNSTSDVTINSGTKTIVYASGTSSVHSLTSSQPISITGGSLTVLANSTLSDGLAMTGGSLTASGTGVILAISGTTSDGGGSLIALAGATVSLPSLTTAGGAIGSTTTLEASGTGSQLSLPGVTSITEDKTSIFSELQVQALAGATVNLSALTQITGGAVQVESDGASSTMNLSALNSFTGQWTFAQQPASLQVTHSGTVLGNSLTNLSGVGLTLDGTGTISTSQFTAITGANVTISGGSPNLSNVTNINAATVQVSGGATVALPGVTSYTGGVGFETTTLSASGANSSLSLVNLMTITEDTTSGFSTLSVQALAGGNLALPAVTQITGGAVQIKSDGTNSSLNLSHLTTFTGTAGDGASWLQVTNAATALDGALTSLSVAGLTLDGTGTVAVSQYTSIANGSITLSDGGVSFVSPAFTALTNINGSNLTVSGGASLTLSGVTSYAGTTGHTDAIEVTGTGSALSLPALSSITEDTTSNGSVITVQALAGGSLGLAALTQITGGGVQLESNGTNSQLNVSALTTFTGFYNLGEAASGLQVTNSGTALDGALTSLNLAGLTLDGTGTVATSQYTAITRGFITLTDGTNFVSPSFSGLTNFNDSNATISGGANLSIPGVTAYLGSYPGTIGFNTTTLEATGTGSVLSLPNLATITEDATSVFSGFQIEALAAGHLNLPALTSIGGGDVQLEANGASSVLNVSALTSFQQTYIFAATDSAIQATSSGTVLDGNLVTLNGAGITLDGTGTLSTSQITTLTGSSIMLSGGANLSLANIISFTGYPDQTTTLQATGTGTKLTLPNITTITEDGTQFFSGLAIQALAGAEVSLPALTSITDGTVNLKVDGTGSILNVPLLSSFDKTSGGDSSVQVTNHGTLQATSLTTLGDVNFTYDATTTPTLASGQAYQFNAGTSTLTAAGSMTVQGGLAVSGTATLSVSGSLAVSGSGALVTSAGATLNVSGNLLGNTQNVAQFNMPGTLLLNGPGTADSPQDLEAMSYDLGGNVVDYQNNFAYGTLKLSSGTYVELVDVYQNSPTAPQVPGTVPAAGLNAVYVDNLIVPFGATLNLNGLHLYAQNSQVSGTIVGGTLTSTPLMSTRTSVAASATSITTGQPITLTATVSNTTIPSEGTVTFMNGTNVLGTQPVSNGTATLGNVVLPAGENLITATYSDPLENYSASSTTLGPNSIITTIAGNGTGGSSGNGGQATAAELDLPQGVAVDTAGDIFIADTASNVIREVNALTHLITVVAGSVTSGLSGVGGGPEGDGGQATAAELAAPIGIAFDSAGDLLIADSGNNRIREVNALTQIITTVAGNGNTGYRGDNGQATAAELSDPQSIALDSAGDIFIADSNNAVIREVNALTHTITTFAGNGIFAFSGDGGPATAASLNDPTGVALDSSGDLFIADLDNNRVREVNAATQKINTVAGNGASGNNGDAGQATAASLNGPKYLAIDSAGDLFIDQVNSNIREVNVLTQVITTVAGKAGLTSYSGDGGPATAAGIAARGIALDSVGDIFIADTFHNRIREVSTGATIVNVSQVLHAPTVTSATTTENTQSTSGLMLTPNALDAGYAQDFQVTNITGGTLFLSDGKTLVTNGQFITVAQGAAGLKYTPTANSIAQGSFTVQESTSASTTGLGGSTAQGTITVTASAPAVMDLVLEAQDPTTGDILTSVQAGQQFNLVAYVQDVRSTPYGVFSAYTNVSYNSNFASIGPDANFNYGSDFTAAENANTVTPGIIADAGAFDSNETFPANRMPPENPGGQYLLWSVPVSATAVGSVTFTPSSSNADGNDHYLTSVYNDLNDAPPVDYVPATVQVTLPVPAAMNVALQAQDPITGNVLTSVQTGQAFNLVAYVQDVRSTPYGVFSAFTDVSFNSSLASIASNASFTYGSDFNFLASGETSTAGLIADAGGAQSNPSYPANRSPAENPGGQYLLWSVPVTAGATSGTLTFVPASANADSVVFDTSLYDGTIVAGEPSDVVNYVPATVVVTSPPSQPTLTISSAQTTDSATGPTNLTFTVSLSQPATQTVTVLASTSEGGANPALEGVNYTSTQQTLTFPVGATSENFTVPIAQATQILADETFLANIGLPTGAVLGSQTQAVGTIVNGDFPTLTVPAASVQDGSIGTSPVVFTATLSTASTQTITVPYAVADGAGSTGAKVNTNYTYTAGTLTFLPGQTVQTISVPVLSENNTAGTPPAQSFNLNLFTPIHVTLAQTTAIGTINEAAPSVQAPTVTGASTVQNMQTTSGLVVTPNAADVGVVTGFQITGITGGTLYLNNGVTPVVNGQIVSLAQAALGLKFTPAINSSVTGSITVQDSTSIGLGGPTVTATIPITVVPPTSSVTALPSRTSLTSLTVDWSGTSGSGGPIASYNIYVSVDGGPFLLTVGGIPDTSATSAVFTLPVGHTYGFISQAVDKAGNIEPLHATADTTVAIAEFPWQNPGNPLNVLGTVGSDVPIVPLDALLIIDYLNNNPASSSLPTTFTTGAYFLDVLGTGVIVPKDALQVIDYLNSHPVVTPAIVPAVAGSTTNSVTDAAAGSLTGAADAANVVPVIHSDVIPLAASPSPASTLAANVAVSVPAQPQDAAPIVSPAVMASAQAGTPIANSAVSVPALSAFVVAESTGPAQASVKPPAGAGTSAQFTSGTSRGSAVNALLFDSSSNWWDE